jgi:hypothetical protein
MGLACPQGSPRLATARGHAVIDFCHRRRERFSARCVNHFKGLTSCDPSRATSIGRRRLQWRGGSPARACAGLRMACVFDRASGWPMARLAMRWSSRFRLAVRSVVRSVGRAPCTPGSERASSLPPSQPAAPARRPQRGSTSRAPWRWRETLPMPCSPHAGTSTLPVTSCRQTRRHRIAAVGGELRQPGHQPPRGGDLRGR